MSSLSWPALVAMMIGGASVLPLGCAARTDEPSGASTEDEQVSPSETASNDPSEPVLPPMEPPPDRNDLASMETVWLTVRDRPVVAWVARTPSEQMFGLMQVSSHEMAPLSDGSERGMLFAFAEAAPRGFWMYNTIIPLDIAFLASDGTVVKIHTMPPLTTQSFPSVEPAQFALEVTAGLFGSLGLQEGDKIEIPASVLKTGR